MSGGLLLFCLRVSSFIPGYAFLQKTPFLCSAIGHSWWHVLTVGLFLVFSSVIRPLCSNDIMV